MSADRPVMPPVRLPDEAQLARAALAAPLFARAVRLARWAGPGTRVGAGGELLEKELRSAAAELDLVDAEDGLAATGDAWRIAVDAGLVDIEDESPLLPGDDFGEAEEADAAAGALSGPELDAAYGTARPSEELAFVNAGSPSDVLDLWESACESVLSDAALPDMGDIIEQITAGGDIDTDALDWDPDADADFLDGALANLYLLTAMEDAGAAVPLPALAASLIVPDDMEEPTDDILAEVSEAMMRLDEQFRMLEPVGLVEYRPVDQELFEETDADGKVQPLDEEAEDVTRYGMVKLTPLGLYGLRRRMLDEGLAAPLIGDMADEEADVFLEALPRIPDSLAREEAEGWLKERGAVDAARQLLAAARGDDLRAPVRRLACQQTLALLGSEAEPALREVLADPQLGGLARVWLSERGADKVPEPSQETVFWLTVDTIAAQLGGPHDNSPELQELVVDLVGQHAGFFDSVWKVEHPATPEVLEAMGRLHPDRQMAKQARKAAFKARSR